MPTPTDPTTFAERRRDSAARAYNQLITRDGKLRDLIVGNRNGYTIDAVIALQEDTPIDDATEIDIMAGSYAVQITHQTVRQSGPWTLWATVHNGKVDHFRFETVDQAILHLIAQRHATGEVRDAGAAWYAGKILDVPFPD